MPHVVVVIEEYAHKAQVRAFHSKKTAKLFAETFAARHNVENMDQPWLEKNYNALVFEDVVVEKTHKPVTP